MKKNVVISILIAVIALIAFRLVRNKKKIEEKKQVQIDSTVHVSVTVAPVVSQGTEENLALVGTVVANQVVDIKSEVAGKITKLSFKLGDYVTKGKTLALVDNTIRELSLSTADQSLADAKQNLERYKNLFEGGAATKAQYDQAKLAYDRATNQVSQAKKELSNAAIVAPINGYITDKQVEQGAFLNMGSAIATVVDISQLKVKLSVPERDVYTLKVGDKVTIGATVYPDVKYAGQITFISFKGDDAHNYAVEVAIQNQPKNPLRAGTYVDVAFQRKNKTNTLQIPREALVGSLKHAQVYVVNDKQLVVKRSIVLGADLGNTLEVLKGLKVGEKVVTSGQINLSDSTQVTVLQ